MDLLTPFLIGLFSSIHCLAMCGGLCGVFCRNGIKTQSVLLINFGRIITYSILGMLVAGIIQGLVLRIKIAEIGFWIRLVLGLVLIYLGIRIMLKKSGLHSFIENNFLWKRAKNTLHRISQKNESITQVFKGMLWGFIPCGLLYGVLIAAAATQNFWQGGLFMFAFGLGTIPSMLAASGLMKTWQDKLQNNYVRIGAGLFIVIVGVWSIASPWISHKFIPEHSVFTSIAAFLDSCTP